MVKVFLFSVAVVLGSVAALYTAWGGDEGEPETLLTMAARGGSLSDNGNGSFTLVLEDVRLITWFSDRPERSSGTISPVDFSQSWETDDVQDDPPNAVLSVEEDEYPMELTEMAFDSTSSTFTFTVLHLEEDETSVVEPAQLTDLEFESVALFIDAYPTSVNDQMTD